MVQTSPSPSSNAWVSGSTHEWTGVLISGLVRPKPNLVLHINELGFWFQVCFFQKKNPRFAHKWTNSVSDSGSHSSKNKSGSAHKWNRDLIPRLVLPKAILILVLELIMKSDLVPSWIFYWLELVVLTWQTEYLPNADYITNDNPLPQKQKSKKRIKVTNHINHKPKINKQTHIKNLTQQKIQPPESGLTRILQITKHTKHPRKN